MPIISALLFGISANIDTLMLGFSYGIKKQHISLLTNLFLSTITLLGTLFSIVIGLHLSNLIAPAIAQMAGSIFLILLGLYYCAKYFFKKSFPKQDSPYTITAASIPPDTIITASTSPAAADTITAASTPPANTDTIITASTPPATADTITVASTPPATADTIPSTLSPTETIFLGLTLTLNNAGMGIGVSLAGTHVFWTLGITFFTSAIFLIAGNRLGTHLAASFPWQGADLLSGLSIIILGVFFLVS